MEQSCNTAFAQIAGEVGAEDMEKTAEGFGFNQHYFDDLSPQAISEFPQGVDEAQLGQTGFGQFNVSATPLQMAMVAAGIANGGSVMKPYLVDEEQSADLNVLSKTDPEEFSQAVSATTASEVTKLMVSTVDNGTASPAAIPGISVAGKTGTAQTGKEDTSPYAWFISFAPADNPEVAVAVMIQNADIPRDEVAGGLLGGPIAKAVMEAVIRSSQTPSGFADDSRRYRLDARIATGGMGEVWRATDTLLDRSVAVKLLKTEYADNPTFRVRFESEAQHAASLHHPNIATVFDVGEANLTDGSRTRRPYLVMELVEGQPLSAVMRPGVPMEPLAVRELLAQAADGLGAAHDSGIVHRDVKPANLIVTPDRQVKVTDFGIAQARRRGAV